MIGPGSAPALCGPTRRAPPASMAARSSRRPRRWSQYPAYARAMACHRSPPAGRIVAWPSQSETSVEVPPISRVMMRSWAGHFGQVKRADNAGGRPRSMPFESRVRARPRPEKRRHQNGITRNSAAAGRRPFSRRSIYRPHHRAYNMPPARRCSPRSNSRNSGNKSLDRTTCQGSSRPRSNIRSLYPALMARVDITEQETDGQRIQIFAGQPLQ